MDTELDSLQIRIHSESSTAAKGLDNLTNSLKQLKATAKGGAGLTSTVNQLHKLSAALNSLGDTKSLAGLANALKPLSLIQKSSGFAATVNSLKKISEITKSLDSATLRKFGLQMQLVAKYIAPVANEMERVSRGFASFPSRIQKVITANYGLSASNKKVANSFKAMDIPLAKSIAGMTAYAFSLGRVMSFLADCVYSINEYVENVNLFQVSMGEFYGEAYEYAQLVSDKLGIDPSEWMRTQGVFMSIANGFGVAKQQAYDLSEGLTELAYDMSSLYNEDVSISAQRLQSALAGEIEPVRHLGIAISEASLKEYALAKGIDESVESMTEQEKALLRSLKLIEGAKNLGAVHDFAKTLESPANAMRVLNQQFELFKRSIGSVLIPFLIQVIPYIQAVTAVLTDMITALATFLGFTMPDWSESDWSGASAGISGVTNELEGATQAAKELKDATMGFDELNIISPKEPSGTGAGGGVSDWASGLEVPNIWDKEAIEAIKTKAEEIRAAIEPIVKVAVAVGAALLAWRIGKRIFDEIKLFKEALNSILGAAPVKSFIQTFGGELAALKMQFMGAGGGIKGFLAVLKTLAETLWKPLGVMFIVASTIKVLVQRFEDIKKAVLDTIAQLGLSEKLEALKAKLNELGERLGFLNGFWNTIKETLNALMDFVGETVITVIGSTLIGAINGLIEAASGIVDTFNGVLDILKGFGEFLVGVFTLDMQKVDEGLTLIGEGIKETFYGLFDTVKGFVTGFVEGFLTAFENLGTALFGDWFPGVVQGFKDWWNSIVEFFTQALPDWWNNTIKPWFTLEKWMELGKMAIEGLFKGLTGALDTVKEWGSNLLDKVKEVLGIHSPSVEFMSIGQFAIAGLQNGMAGISFMSVYFNNQLMAMRQLAQVFANDMKSLVDTLMAMFLAAINASIKANTTAASAIAAAYQQMANISNAAIQSIIRYLDSIPRSITTVHTIVTRHVSSGRGSRSADEYASGGFPTTGQMFIAREAGPELVGTIGGKTAVANNDQIIQGIAQGVYDAMVRANSAISSDGQPIVIELSGEKIGRSVTNWQQKQGVSVTKGAYAHVY